MYILTPSYNASIGDEHFIGEKKANWTPLLGRDCAVSRITDGVKLTQTKLESSGKWVVMFSLRYESSKLKQSLLSVARFMEHRTSGIDH